MNISQEKLVRIMEILIQLDHLDDIMPYTSVLRQDYNELKNQSLTLLSNEQLRVIGSRVADLQELVRKSKVQR